jgi:hypothetical protein
MSKIDELLTIAHETNGRLATIEQWVKDKESRCKNHGERLETVEINLNGSGEQEGLNEWKRNFAKRHALMVTLIPSSIWIGFELFKYKITGKW